MAFPLTGATLGGAVTTSTPAVPIMPIAATATWLRTLSLWTQARTVPITRSTPAVPVVRVVGGRVWQAQFGVLRPPTTGQLWPRGDRIVVG